MNNRKNQILRYLYTFRFLTRIHIQKLLNHKHQNRITIWLNELTQNTYIRRYHNQKTVTIPAIYSLGLKARKYIKNNPELNDINTSQLNRIWRERSLSIQFRTHCLFIADIYISLLKLVETTGAQLHFYTKTQLKGMNYMLLPNPDGYFSIEEKDGTIKRYFLDIFDDLPARMMLRKRVRQYTNYYEAQYWQDHTKKPFPYVIFICPDDRSKNYLYSFIQKILLDQPELSFYTTTRDLVKTNGFNKNSLQKVEAVDM